MNKEELKDFLCWLVDMEYIVNTTDTSWEGTYNTGDITITFREKNNRGSRDAYGLEQEVYIDEDKVCYKNYILQKQRDQKINQLL